MKKNVIVISGPTASGKTKLAIELALHFNTQIISFDSRQCFKELNIGVSKPDNIELSTIQHYFINSHSIHEVVNAGIFEDYSLVIANKILNDNNIAIMVGGTGLYLQTFTNGIDEIPIIKEDIRKDIRNSYEIHGLPWLQNQIETKDTSFWNIVDKQNPNRLMRALEVINATGNSITHYQKKFKANRKFNITQIVLSLPKEQLHLNINTRVETMMQKGLLDEVLSLYDYRHLNALQTVGYKELFEFIEGKVTIREAIENIKSNTRKYAKRQITWFKRTENPIVFNPNSDSFVDLVELITQSIK